MNGYKNSSVCPLKALSSLVKAMSLPYNGAPEKCLQYLYYAKNCFIGIGLAATAMELFSSWFLIF